jgi:hypothetical protein
MVWYGIVILYGVPSDPDLGEAEEVAPPSKAAACAHEIHVHVHVQIHAHAHIHIQISRPVAVAVVAAVLTLSPALSLEEVLPTLLRLNLLLFLLLLRLLLHLEDDLAPLQREKVRVDRACKKGGAVRPCHAICHAMPCHASRPAIPQQKQECQPTADQHRFLFAVAEDELER